MAVVPKAMTSWGLLGERVMVHEGIEITIAPPDLMDVALGTTELLEVALETDVMEVEMDDE
jgi:hypothetical protein